MSFQNSPHSESGRSEQVISQFLLKCLHVILDSRIPSLRPQDHSGDLNSAASRVRKTDKWFHLALGDRPAAFENLNFWHRNVMDPMIIDIVLVCHETPNDSASSDMYTERTNMETVIERWVVQYETPRTLVPPPSEGPVAYKKTYKKSIILLRSLYSMLRLLPAYKIFRQLGSVNQSYNFDIIYKVSSFGEPFTRSEEQAMKQYTFVPVEAHPGRLCVSVTYHPTLSDFNLELSTSLPPQIITDYVGSPATDPLKVFSSADREFSSTSVPSRGMHSTPFQRPHSWTGGGLHRGASPFAQNYPSNASPPVYRMSPTPDYSPSPPDIFANKIQNYRMSTHKKGMSYDEYHLSPPFSPSPSPSPSPPTNMYSGHSLQSRLRTESSPVNIPLSSMGRNSRYLTPSSSEPNRHSLPPMSPRSSRHDLSSQESPSGNRSFRKTDAVRTGDLYSGLSNLNLLGQKVSRDSKDDSGRFSGLVSSNGSPRKSFSRSSSRLSFQDDLDDIVFPFVVDDVDTPSSQSRTLDGKEALDSTSQAYPSGRKSQDAAIGVLVQMLKTAPPLRQDSSSYLSQSSRTEIKGEVSAASSYFMSRKTSDALEELRGYKDMKDLLLSQSGTQMVTPEKYNSGAFVG